MAAIYAGTSGWAYPTWKPKFYPPKLPAAKFLEYYATRLNTVEVNYTFRHYASEKTQANWIAQTPAGFKFSIKAHQRITHVKRLRNAEDATLDFLASLQPLGDSEKLGMILFQLPPFVKADAALLEDFLAKLPKAWRFAFEFRHESWFADAVLESLRKYNAALCVAESENLESPDLSTADFCYYRLRKPEYTARERKQVAENVRKRVNEKRDVFVYFKHEDTPEGALYAEELLASTGQKSAGAAVDL